MRVTHVITRLIVGGAQENTIASVLGLNEKPGVRADLLSGPTSGPEGSLEDVFASHRELLTIIPSLVRPVHPLRDWSALRDLTRVLRNRRPDIVHTHSGKAGVLGRLAAARAGVPVIIHTVHGPSFGDFQGALPNLLFRFAEKFAARSTHHFVTVADALRQQYLAAGIGRPDMFTTILSGFDLAPFLKTQNDLQLRSRYGLAPDDIVVGKVARLFKLKGHDALLAAAPELVQRCPRLKFLLVGGGEWRSRFERLVRDLGLESRVIFTGLVPPAEVARLIGIMDVVVHLSRREGLARVLPQALAASRPVVACDCDGAGEVCLDGRTGYLVNVGDREGLVERILRLANNEALRRQLGRQGRQFVIERFSTSRMVDELYELYCRLSSPYMAESPSSSARDISA